MVNHCRPFSQPHMGIQLLNLYLKLAGGVVLGLALGWTLQQSAPAYLGKFLFWVGVPAGIVAEWGCGLVWIDLDSVGLAFRDFPLPVLAEQGLRAFAQTALALSLVLTGMRLFGSRFAPAGRHRLAAAGDRPANGHAARLCHPGAGRSLQSRPKFGGNCFGSWLCRFVAPLAGVAVAVWHLVFNPASG